MTKALKSFFVTLKLWKAFFLSSWCSACKVLCLRIFIIMFFNQSSFSNQRHLWMDWRIFFQKVPKSLEIKALWDSSKFFFSGSLKVYFSFQSTHRALFSSNLHCDITHESSSVILLYFRPSFLLIHKHYLSKNVGFPYFFSFRFVSFVRFFYCGLITFWLNSSRGKKTWLGLKFKKRSKLRKSQRLLGAFRPLHDWL